MDIRQKRTNKSKYTAMNILVTGANGQLGNEIRVLARRREEAFRQVELSCGQASGQSAEQPWHFIFTDVTEHPDGEPTEHLDITAPISMEGPLDAIINCAAWTNVDAAEDNEPTALRLNADAAANLAALAADKEALLVHISTDYVFDGTLTRPCREDDPVGPVSAYGRTKLAGEKAVEASGCRYVIIRTAWLYSEFGKNFVKTMLRLTAEKPSVSVVNDQTGTPTYALDLAEAIFAFLDREAVARQQAAQNGAGTPGASLQAALPTDDCGTYHFSNGGVCTWYDFASEIAALAGHSGVVQPCTSDQFPSKVHRPAYSVLDKTKIATTLGIAIPRWQDSLKVCLTNMGII